MTQCTKIRKKSKKVCIGALNRKIIIYTRSIITPTSGAIDFDESLLEAKTVWAMVEPTTGTTLFDGTNTDQVISHKIYIRYSPNLTPEKWVEFPSVNGGANVYLDIVNVENLDESNLYYLLRCNLRGDIAKEVNLST